MQNKISNFVIQTKQDNKQKIKEHLETKSKHNQKNKNQKLKWETKIEPTLNQKTLELQWKQWLS